ncbi:probable tRNA (uracil-O(2)-)-methyltransferase isoform X1 [Serinus canaria]|uniref:probable tRNA (uracil-O(2)-)-methyltransferase isoform X1 n=1 Tax=Serinus canaria TaxID=9135 RepID=UPI0021CCF66F|nr:probable tRNA (uracil-O(2)-)-methyltransferase isoform X1 [Serinus canaria]
MGPVGTAAVRDPGGAALPHGFWAAVRVWLQKPQVANRRLSGAAVQAEGTVSLGEGGEISPSIVTAGAGGDDGGQEGRTAGAAELHRLWREVRGQLALPPPLTAWGGPGELRAVLRTLLPRGRPAAPPARELAVQDVYNGTVTFLPLEENSEGKYLVKKCNIYQIQLKHIKDEEWSVSVVAPFPEDWFSDGIVYPKLAWLGNELLSKLAKWSVEQKPSEFKSTLSLISVAKYSKVYQDLKEKYKEMVKVWPEVTDPEKFVYEDVAIATYLLILWEEERKEKELTKKQSFVDLGCGNGLLVHILNNEGHPGRGIDVRRRKIWDMYGPETHLEEATIIPGDSHLFPDTDWLIGNHSDELTPWIPVIAARSSYSCCYFVLPCCFFDFHGKYSRRQSKKTQYREYLDFVAQVGFVCGFHVEEDCLRIPSTKRVSFIGKSRTYPAAERALIDKQITEFINSRRTCAVATCDRRVGFNHEDHCGGLCKEAGSEPPEDETETAGTIWMPGFQPREKVEQVRNCASLPRDFVDEVVLNVANLLLNAAPQKSCSDKQGGNMNTWNQGESLSLREVAEHLDKEILKKLKSEYGGLQTLLKNNHQVFEVLDGRVHIRDWRKEKPPSKTKPEVKRRLSAEAFKTRLCWFFIHHPDGCSLPSEACPYAHGTEELRQSQMIKKKKHIQ